jgi:hypothetical protein
MPPPMANAPAPVHAQRLQNDIAAAMREARDSATKAAKTAIAIDNKTSAGSNSPSKGVPNPVVWKTLKRLFNKCRSPVR